MTARDHPGTREQARDQLQTDAREKLAKGSITAAIIIGNALITVLGAAMITGFVLMMWLGLEESMRQQGTSVEDRLKIVGVIIVVLTMLMWTVKTIAYGSHRTLQRRHGLQSQDYGAVPQAIATAHASTTGRSSRKGKKKRTLEDRYDPQYLRWARSRFVREQKPDQSFEQFLESNQQRWLKISAPAVLDGANGSLCLHEAAHAVVADALDHTVLGIRLGRTDQPNALGQTLHQPNPGVPSQDYAWNNALAAVAGNVAEQSRGHANTGSRNDFEQVYQWLMVLASMGRQPDRYNGPLRVPEMLDTLVTQARAILDERQPALEALTAALGASKKPALMDGAEIVAIIDAAMGKPFAR